MIKTFTLCALNVPGQQKAKLNEIQPKRLDLRQHPVQSGAIQNTCKQGVGALQLRHHRGKSCQRGGAKMAGNPNRIEIRHLIHTSMFRVPMVRGHHQDLMNADLHYEG
jgi:hypothetical protein